MFSQTIFSIAPLLLTAVALTITLWFFFQLKSEIARLAVPQPAERVETNEMLHLLSVRLDQLSASVDEQRAIAPITPIPPPAGLNLGKRTHVLRLSRRGDTPDHIAATLHIPRREVELLLKVHDLSLKTVAITKPDAIH